MTENLPQSKLEKNSPFVCVFFVLWALSTKIFYPEINNFFNSFFPERLGDFSGWQIFISFMIGLIFFMAPFCLAALGFYELINAAIKNARVTKHKIVIFFSALVFTILFLQILLLSEFQGYTSAVFFSLSNINIIYMTFISFLTFTFARTSSQLIFAISYWFLIAMFLFTVYQIHGMDDGCNTVGGDRLFSGGGYVECDPNYEKQAEINKAISKNQNFNTDTLFAAELLISQIIGFLGVFLGWCFRYKYR